MATQFRIKRRVTGAAGAPASLLAGELAYNNVDGVIYVGFGDNGSGVATSVKAIAGDTFVANLPAGFSNGKILGIVGGQPAWVNAPEGAIYTAGNDITLTGSAFSVDRTTLFNDVTLTGNPTAPTAESQDSSQAIATTEFVAGQIMSLALQSGTYYSPKGHTHDAGEITSGEFDATRIPTLDASKISTGILDVARLPLSLFAAPVVAPSNIASLAAIDDSIQAGTTVITSDGRSWAYTGSGAKNVEASYRELADKTPEWSVIANKPVFSTVATSGAYGDLTGRPSLHAVATSGSYVDLTNKPTISAAGASGSYNDLTNRPTLGTMAAQNAASVAITGGTINGVILDGGVF